MFTSQRSPWTGLLPILAVLLAFSSKEQTTLSKETTAAPVVTNSSLTLNISSSDVLRECGTDMADYCKHGGQCVYHQDQDTPSCKCKDEYEGDRCQLITTLVSKCYKSDPLGIGLILGITVVVFLLAMIIICCVYRRCAKSAPLKVSAQDTCV